MFAPLSDIDRVVALAQEAEGEIASRLMESVQV
jgi:hypothetical protein